MDGIGEISAPTRAPQGGHTTPPGAARVRRDCECGPWITPALLEPSGRGLYRCPDRHCLHPTAVVAGRIADHADGRNVVGPCPWVGIRVDPTPPPCGCGPTVTTGHLRIVCRYRGRPGGAVTAISCPGGCTNLAPVRDGYIAVHRSCPWNGVQIRDRGLYPPVFAMP